MFNHFVLICGPNDAAKAAARSGASPLMTQSARQPGGSALPLAAVVNAMQTRTSLVFKISAIERAAAWSSAAQGRVMVSSDKNRCREEAVSLIAISHALWSTA